MSERLRQIQAAIEKLTDAKAAGSAAEIAAAQALLSAPLSQDFTPEQALTAGLQRTGNLEELLKDRGRVINWAKEATDGIKIAMVNLEKPDRLAISPAEIDAKINKALGIAGQAAKLFIDPKTGTVIRGEKVGELKPRESGLAVISSLAAAEQPIGQAALTATVFEQKGGTKPVVTKSVISRVNAWAEETGLPRVVERAREQGYYLSPAYQVIGVEIQQPSQSPPAVPSAEARPKTFTISEVLETDKIKGKMTDVRLRHLAQGLVASGHLRVGEHVMERHAGDKSYLDYTPAGIERLAGIAIEFGSKGKIYVDTVREWLDSQTAKVEPPAAAETEPVALGVSQLAEAAGVSTSVVTTMLKHGKLVKDVHYGLSPQGRFHIYNARAVADVTKVGEKMADEKAENVSLQLIEAALTPGITKERKNIYGKNGYQTLNTDVAEYIALTGLKNCLPRFESITGKPVNEEFAIEIEIDNRLGELAEKLAIGQFAAGITDEQLEKEFPVLGPTQAVEIRRGIAASVFHIANNPATREFHFIKNQRPGVDLLVTAMKNLAESGHTDLIAKFAKMFVESPDTVYAVGRDGSVNPLSKSDPLSRQGE